MNLINRVSNIRSTDYFSEQVGMACEAWFALTDEERTCLGIESFVRDQVVGLSADQESVVVEAIRMLEALKDAADERIAIPETTSPR